jgi:GTPase SAR1 family protein
MGNRENKIIAFVGLAGTGKTTATEYIADKGFPRVVVDSDIKSIIEQIHGLDGAGQHNIIVDGLGKWSDFKTLKHKFPGEVVTIAVISNKLSVIDVLANNPKLSLNSRSRLRDWSDIEKFNISDRLP